MKFNNRFNVHGFQDNDNSPDVGPQISLWGSVLSALGDIMQAYGSAISIEESINADRQQKQALDKLQSQIDDLQKAQSRDNLAPTDIKTVINLLEHMVELLDDSKANK